MVNLIKYVLQKSSNFSLPAINGIAYVITNTGAGDITITLPGSTAKTLSAGKTIELWYDGTWYSTDDRVAVSSTSAPTIITGDLTLEVNKVYNINATAMVTLTLPATMAYNDSIQITDLSGFGWKIKPNSGQTIKRYNRETPQGNNNFSFIQSNIAFTNILLRCSVANTKWNVVNQNDVYRGKGYHMGGGTTVTTIIEDMDFTFETSNAIMATLNTAKQGGIPLNSNNKGYCCGGYTTAVIAVIEDMNFVVETSDVITATLDIIRGAGTGVSGNNKGYVMGAYSAGYVNSIEDMNFTNETSAGIAATLNSTKSGGVGVWGKLKGYCMGGTNGTMTTAIDDMNFATETSDVITATLNTAKNDGAGVSGNSKGYFVGGYTGSMTAVIEDMNFTNETSNAISATLNSSKFQLAGVSARIKGYIMGGNTGSDANTIDDMNFITESSELIAATLNTARSQGVGVSGCL